MLRKKRPKIKTFIGLILILALLIGINFLGVYRGIKNFFYEISLPVQMRIDRGGQKVLNFWDYLIHLNKIQEQNYDLTRERNELLSQKAQLIEYQEQNKVLKQALDLKIQEDFELILARLVIKDISQGTVLIDQGSSQVSPGMPLINENKVLIGQVSETYSDFSRVRLTSNPHSSFPGKILDKDITGIVKGKGGGQIYLDAIPQDKEIFSGDIVVTDISSIFPPELLVGRVSKIEKSDIEPFQQAKITSLVEIEKLEYVFVVSEFEELKQNP